MSHLTLTFLGQFQIMLQDQPAIRFETDKVRALLAYLIVEGNQAHSRSTLAALLWPDYNEENARTNLRHALHQLRQAIGDAKATPPWLLITRQTLQFNPDAPYTLDVQAFSTLLDRVTNHAHAHLAQCQSCLQTLYQAAAIYQGDFLAGFAVNDSAPFEEWRRIKQEQLHLRAVELFHQLARHSEAIGNDPLARQYAARQLELEPWREEAHRQIMRVLARSGQRSAALAQYQLCCRILTAELDAQPEPATTALYAEIRDSLFPGKQAKVQENREAAKRETAAQTRRSDASSDASTGAAFHAPIHHDWGEMPRIDACQGRTDERNTLQHWLVQERSRFIAILGMGGVGKTTLAAKVVQDVAEQFGIVIWRSLLNAPPLSEILREWLQILSHQTMTTMPERLDEQLRLLLEYLRQKRVLLVLDNFESILQAESHAGELRPRYADYTQLIQIVGASNHHSCLLLTSREQPQAMTRLLGQQPAVRRLSLAGLDQQAGHTILQMHGVVASSQEAMGLIEHYSGNPLALQIVANTIVNLFAGDVQAFQQAGMPVFDNIRQVLDEQFARLSALELELLIWLAIEREPVTAVSLRQNLVQPPTQIHLLESLHSLQRRSLLETHVVGFTMQNVVIEYTTEYLLEQICYELEMIYQAEQTPTGPAASRNGSQPGGLKSTFLNRFALLKTQAKEYVSQSQARLLLQPIAERLQGRLGRPAIQALLHSLLDQLRADTPRAAGYAAGNLLNLLRHLDFAIADYNFSQLYVWQADLRRAKFAAVNFTGADLAQSAFTLAFDLRAITFSPSKQVLLAGILEGDLCLWRAADGQLHHALRYPSNSTAPVVFSATGQLVAAGGIDFAVRIWSTEQNKQLHTFFGHQDKLYGLAFSPNGQQMASSSRDGTVRIWDLSSGYLLHTLHEHANAITALAFCADGTILAGGGGEQIICLWDTASGTLIRTLHGHVREIECIAFAPDNTLLASGAHDGTIHVWDGATGQLLSTLEGHQKIIRSIAFHPDGHTLASGGADRIVRLWDMRSDHALHTLVGHKYEVNFLTFSRDGQVLASGSIDRTIHLWDSRAGHLLDLVTGHAEMVRAVCISPDGQWLASSGADGIVRLWDLRQGKYSPECDAVYSTVARQLLGHTEQVYTVAFSPDGRLLASGGVDRVIYLWDVATGKALHILGGHQGTVKAVAFSPDGTVIASGSADRTVRLWSLATTENIRVLNGHTDEVGSVAFSPDGNTIVSGSLDYSARLWSVARCEAIYQFKNHACAIYSAGFTRDGRRIITTQWDFTVKQWEAGSGQPMEGWNIHGIKSLGARFSPDGEIFACVTANQSIQLRHFATGEIIRTLRGHRMTILSVDFHPSQPLLVSSSWDGMIKLWDLRSGICLQTFQAPGPYAGMNITGVTGISAAQKAALKALGAIEESRGSLNISVN